MIYQVCVGLKNLRIVIQIELFSQLRAQSLDRIVYIERRSGAADTAIAAPQLILPKAMTWPDAYCQLPRPIILYDFFPASCLPSRGPLQILST